MDEFDGSSGEHPEPRYEFHRCGAGAAGRVTPWNAGSVAGRTRARSRIAVAAGASGARAAANTLEGLLPEGLLLEESAPEGEELPEASA